MALSESFEKRACPRCGKDRRYLPHIDEYARCMSCAETPDVVAYLDNIDEIAISVYHWANSVFPMRTDTSMFLKMFQELGELSEAETKEQTEDELADIFIMLLDYAHRKEVRLSVAIAKKMAINKKRVWRQNKLGAFSHVK